MLRAADSIWKTDTGRARADNEDSAYARPPLYVVADGMGGAQAGEVASALAVEEFRGGLTAQGTAEQRLSERVQAANRRIYANWQSSTPSRFIDELPEAHVQRAGSAALQRESRLLAPSVFSNGPLMARRTRVAEPWEQAARPARPDSVNVGQRIFHQKFGYGRVTAVDDDKLDIDFEKAGQKRVLDRFVEKV